MSFDILEVELLVDKKIVMETLSRAGIANKKDKVLFPSCYLYEEDGKCYLAHFKQMFILTRKTAYDNICQDDIERRNAIAFLLKSWGLINIVNEDSVEDRKKYVFVLNYKDKADWQINHKFRCFNRIEDNS